ncbi:hypothetical protein RMATCC62417_05521 [Rhizopus microsporus]|nr:hypothetical protein RMATCC62417_05521 [Rhizopus microsporus]CEI89101.1 hypothetical protein RMCBS344292_03471 [Rhizopus microsporus]
MVAFNTLTSSIVLVVLGAMAVPSSAVPMIVKNKCSYSVQANQLTNVVGNPKAVVLSPGQSTTFDVASNWGGRIWGRKGCTGSSDCQPSAPSSLAEFTLNGAGGKDFYDVSFVDGFNLPISVAPNGGTTHTNKYDCGTPTCANLPSCPAQFQVKDGSGNVIACNSACRAYGTPEYCCTGDYNSPQTCKASQYANSVKQACPDVYSYAYDDTSSTYTCASSSGYTITFCP